MKHAKRLLPLVPLVLASSSHAVDLNDWLKLEGFGTLSANTSASSFATMRPDPRNAVGTSDGSTQLNGDSLLSAQLTVNPTGQLKGVWQVLSKDDLVDRSRPRTEWMYASWDAAPGWNLKGGRIVLPVFMMSDTRNVAYAQTTVRPPNVLYGLNPVTNLDGASVGWAGKAMEGDLSLGLSAGKTDVTLSIGTLKFSSIVGTEARWSRGPFSVRLGYSHYDADAVSPTATQLINTLDSGATGCTNCTSVLAQRVPLTGISAHILAIGASYEEGAFQLQAEYADRKTNTTLANSSSAWYVLGGYRLGSWTPYLAFGELSTHEAPLGLQTAAVAGPVAAAANAAFDQYLRFQADRRSRIAGIRWDFHENYALKLQYETVELTQDPVFGSNAAVSFPAPPPIGTYKGAPWDGKDHMVSLNLDFVF